MTPGQSLALFSCRTLSHVAALPGFFELALAAMRDLPLPPMLHALARMTLAFAGEGWGFVQLSPEEASLTASLEKAERGEFATHDEMRAVRAKHGL